MTLYLKGERMHLLLPEFNHQQLKIIYKKLLVLLHLPSQHKCLTKHLLRTTTNENKNYSTENNKIALLFK